MSEVNDGPGGREEERKEAENKATFLASSRRRRASRRGLVVPGKKPEDEHKRDWVERGVSPGERHHVSSLVWPETMQSLSESQILFLHS
jgi:hypothetical protein